MNNFKKKLSKPKIVSYLIVSCLFVSLGHAQITEKEQKKFDRFGLMQKRTRYLEMLWLIPTGVSSNSQWIEWYKMELETVVDLENKISILYVLGKLERTEGNYRNSLTYLEAGLNELRSNPELKNKQLFYHPSSNLDLVDELGQLCIDLRDYEKAELIFNESLKIRIEKYGKNNRALANTYNGLGDISFYQKKHEAAVVHYTKALDVALNGSGYRSKTIETKTYYRLSRSFYHSESYNEAIKNGKKSFKRSMNIAGGAGQRISDPLLTMRSLNLLAMTYLKMGDLENANNYYMQADELYKEYYPTEMNAYTELLKTKANMAWAENKQEQACISLEQMMDNHIAFIKNNFVALTEKEKQDFFDRITEDQNLYFDYNIQTFRTTKNGEILESILNRRLVTKGFILNDQNKIKHIIRSGDDAGLKTALQEWQRAKGLLSFELYNNPLGTKPDSLRAIINNYERTLSEKTNLLGKDQDDITWSAVSDKLKNDQVAMECIRYTSGDSIQYATILILPENKLELVLQTYSKNTETNLVKVYRNSIEYELEDRKTHLALWKMIDERLTAYSEVLFSPDGIYNQLNINTLMKDDGAYVIDDYQVINVGNLKDLAVELDNNYSKAAILIGRPQYDYDMALSALPSNENYRSNLFMEFDGFRDQKFSDLPGTAHEITSISSTLSDFNWSVVNKTGSEATEQYAKSITDPGILHIATHGFFLSSGATVNPMMKSGLVMAGVNNTDIDHEDGILTAYEVTNLNLDNTWLVVLSACETGLGETKNGEGVFGLQRALTVAGASNVMMTLWKVDDTATMQLMSTFYRQLAEGVKLEEAFRNSQLEIRETYKNPKYWGAFVLVKARN